ncbi:hypothetical protein D3C86_1456070 [compost metagenome]
MAEHVGQVADRARLAELAHQAPAELQVADQALAADEKFVGQDVPGADGELARSDQGGEALAVLGLDRQVVLQHHRLAVQEEVRQGPLLEQVQDPIDHLHQAQAVGLEGAVPLAIPVGVRNDDDFFGLQAANS